MAPPIVTEPSTVLDPSVALMRPRPRPPAIVTPPSLLDPSIAGRLAPPHRVRPPGMRPPTMPTGALPPPPPVTSGPDRFDWRRRHEWRDFRDFHHDYYNPEIYYVQAPPQIVHTVAPAAVSSDLVSAAVSSATAAVAGHAARRHKELMDRQRWLALGVGGAVLLAVIAAVVVAVIALRKR